MGFKLFIQSKSGYVDKAVDQVIYYSSPLAIPRKNGHIAFLALGKMAI